MNVARDETAMLPHGVFPGWPAQHFAEVNGRRVHYVAAGEGPPLILVHGLLGYSFSWRRNVAALARHFRVYAPDLPGWGYSDCPADNGYSFNHAAASIADFAGAVGEARVALVGHSLGGAAALICAAREPRLVERLVLLAPVNPFSGRARIRIALGGAPVLGHLIRGAARTLLRPLARIELKYRLYGDPRQVDDETVEGYIAPLRRPETVRVLQRTFAAWDPRQVGTLLPAVHQPVLLLWGARDRVVEPASARSLVNALPRAELAVFPGVGHELPEEAPGEVNRRIIRFCHGGTEESEE